MITVILLAGQCAEDEQVADKKTSWENLVKYMQEARKITREFAASERAQRLFELKRSYAQKVKHAPDNARRAAVQWIAAPSRAKHKIKSGKMEDTAVFDVLRFRNRALSACGMSADKGCF